MIYIIARKGNNLLTDFFIANDSSSLLSFGDICPLLNHFYDGKAAFYKNQLAVITRYIAIKKQNVIKDILL
ncbi:hypothetical protein DVP80_18475 [Yersinia enterocolitica]|nr:hypothetical protein [Yersinia enterocolitica]